VGFLFACKVVKDVIFMLSKFKRMWKTYLESIPRQRDHEEITDKQIIRDYFCPEPVSLETQELFKQLVQLLCFHLAEDVAKKRSGIFLSKLKPGVDAESALVAGFHSGGKTIVRQGFMTLDWKAREEILWQAQLLSKVHAINDDWSYDCESDINHKDWESRQEFPVMSPLRDFSKWLAKYGLALLTFCVDDSLHACVISQGAVEKTLNLCAELKIQASIT
jgi:hypothetical protein